MQIIKKNVGKQAWAQLLLKNCHKYFLIIPTILEYLHQGNVIALFDIPL